MKRDWRRGAVWLIAALCLGLNDYFFKGSGWLPGVFTGKLSDFSGLIVAPAGLVTAIRLAFPERFKKFRREFIALSLLLVGLGFTAINLSESASALLIQALSVIGVSWSLWCDPTDLIALSALPLAYFVIGGEAMPVATRGRDDAWRGLAVLASAALCVGSGVTNTDSAHGFLVNQTGQTILLRTASLPGEMDCREGPLIEDGVLVEKDFVPQGTTSLGAGQVMRFYMDDGVESVPQGERCKPLRLAVWPEGGDEAEAVSLVIGFSREQRALPVPHVPEDLEDTSGLALLHLEDGALEIELGEGLRRVELGDGKRSSLPANCSYPELIKMSGSNEPFTIAEIEAGSGRCTTYRSQASAAVTAGMGGHTATDSEDGQDGQGGQGGASASTPSPPPSPEPSVHVCTDEPLDLKLGESIQLRTTHYWGNWPEYLLSRDNLRLLETTVRIQSHHETECAQLRTECGAILVRTPATQGEGNEVLEAAWTTILAREDCPREVRTPGSFAQWVVK